MVSHLYKFSLVVSFALCSFMMNGQNYFFSEITQTKHFCEKMDKSIQPTFKGEGVAFLDNEKKILSIVFTKESVGGEIELPVFSWDEANIDSYGSSTYQEKDDKGLVINTVLIMEDLKMISISMNYNNCDSGSEVAYRIRYTEVEK